MRNVGVQIFCPQLLETFGIACYPRHFKATAHCVLGRSTWLRPISRTLRRGAKSKTVIKSNDLPQGVLQSERTIVDREDNTPAYPAVIQQARNNMQKFEDCVLLTRVGGFYEARFIPLDLIYLTDLI